MRRPGIFIWTVAVFAAGASLFYMKHRVQSLEAELGKVDRKLAAEQETLHVLRAEWAYLTRPERLVKLNKKHLGLVTPTPEQLSGFDAVPPRKALGNATPAGLANREGAR